jgi:hypothetical protein
MGDAASGHSAGAGERRGHKGSTGSSVLTPPTGMPAIPDLEVSFPIQRTDSQPAPDQPPAPPEQRTVIDPCVCGHSRGAHEHYRPGSDCGTCGRAGCVEYRPQNGFFRQLWRKLKPTR